MPFPLADSSRSTRSHALRGNAVFDAPRRLLTAGLMRWGEAASGSVSPFSPLLDMHGRRLVARVHEAGNRSDLARLLAVPPGPRPTDAPGLRGPREPYPLHRLGRRPDVSPGASPSSARLHARVAAGLPTTQQRAAGPLVLEDASRRGRLAVVKRGPQSRTLKSGPAYHRRMRAGYERRLQPTPGSPLRQILCAVG